MATEALQLYTGGDPSWGDVTFDLIGATAALLIWCGREKMLSTPLSYCVAGMLLMSTPAPLVQALATEWRRVSIIPDLVRFDSPLDNQLFGANSKTRVVVAPVIWPVASKVLEITLADEMWPGVHIDEPIADWRPYAALAIEIFVDGPMVVPISVSVRLDHAPVVHVYRRFECAPGPCKILLPLVGLFDRERARVNEVVIYSTRASAGRTIYLGRVVLLKQD